MTVSCQCAVPFTQLVGVSNFTLNTVYTSGFKKKKTASCGTTNAKAKETVFDFLNKIPSSSGESCVIRKKEITQRKEIKKITAKSAF